MTLYIAGPMSSCPKDHNFANFDRVRDELKKRGYGVISPADISRQEFPNVDFMAGELPTEFDYGKMLIKDLTALHIFCDGVFMLHGFWESKDAMLELDFARATGKKVFYEAYGFDLKEYQYANF